jgi:hypothetical protein
MELGTDEEEEEEENVAAYNTGTKAFRDCIFIPNVIYRKLRYLGSQKLLF